MRKGWFRIALLSGYDKRGDFMEYTFDKDILKINQDEIDIYDSTTFKEVLEGSVKRKGITIDLSMVDDMSTPAIQIILSALKTMDALKVKGVRKDVKRELFLLGVSF